MKREVTKNEIRRTEDRILCVTYCGLQNLLSTENAFAYSTRVEGWACDYYHIPRNICVSTGYSPIGKHIDYNLIRKYDEAAAKICSETWMWEQRKPRLDALLADFAGDVERLYF